MAGSAVATAAASGIMDKQVLGGPVWWFFFGVYILAIVLAAFTLVDSQRPERKDRLAEIPEPGWLYPVFSGVYLISVVIPWIPAVPKAVPAIAAIPVFLTPFAMALSVAYLLRVLFPKADQLEE
jgi:hypothetical protein